MRTTHVLLRSVGQTFAAIVLFTTIISAQSIPPRLFYSDLQSGPNTGGQNSKGAMVTIWGNNFGATQGASVVTVGGGAADNYPIWTNTKITFQLGANAETGNILITTGAGTSNGVPFTVRAGNIYFVSTTGSDSSNGSFASPWASIPKAKNTMVAGDTTYVMNGVSQTSIDNYTATLAIQSSGTVASPIALVAYPGASVTVGTPTTPYGIRTPAVSGNKDYWVIAGLRIRGWAGVDLVGVNGWRVIGNDLSCPNGAGQSACFHTDTTTNLAFYGNNVHNIGDQAGSIDKYYHAVYFTTNSNHIDAGWNTVVPNPTGSTTSGGCRAIQFYSTGGSDQFDLHVHDNVVHHAICDGINFATVNPNNGTVEAYNNVVYHVGTGPDPANGSSNYACVLTGSSSSRSANVEIYNNTFYDCGSRGTSDSGAVTLYTPTRLRNNITSQLVGEHYVGGAGGFLNPTGSNNLWTGSGLGPTSTISNVNADAQFINVSLADFRIHSSSPAKDTGAAISTLASDFGGVSRPQGAGYDIGANEYYGGVVQMTCDLNSDGVVSSLDVQIATNQALGLQICSSANLANDGCTVVDVQRVINAAMGQACKVGL